VGARAVAVGVGRAPDHVDQPVERVVDVPAEQVEVGDQRLGVDVVRRTADADRDTARTHLIGLFGAVGNEDPRVQRARRDLASALF